MEAPRLRSMFRNVKTEPRRFQFRSRHLPELDEKWLERKRRAEAALGQTTEHADSTGAKGVRPISFRSGPSGGGDWRARRVQQIRGARWAMIRAGVIAVGLVWLAWKGIQWVEKSDFSGVLKWMENA